MSVKVFRVHPDAVLPARAEEEAAGYDLSCIEDFSISPGELVKVRTGLVIQPPDGFHMEVLARSGNAAKYVIMLANNVGLIDRSFAGPKDEIVVLLYRATKVEQSFVRGVSSNLNSDRPVEFKKGDRIAQLVFRKTEIFDIVEVSKAPKEEDRGGFGSTGVK